jgi:hypothetical protein
MLKHKVFLKSTTISVQKADKYYGLAQTTVDPDVDLEYTLVPLNFAGRWKKKQGEDPGAGTIAPYPVGYFDWQYMSNDPDLSGNDPAKYYPDLPSASKLKAFQKGTYAHSERHLFLKPMIELQFHMHPRIKCDLDLPMHMVFPELRYHHPTPRFQHYDIKFIETLNLSKVSSASSATSVWATQFFIRKKVFCTAHLRNSGPESTIPVPPQITPMAAKKIKPSPAGTLILPIVSSARSSIQGWEMGKCSIYRIWAVKTARHRR